MRHFFTTLGREHGKDTVPKVGDKRLGKRGNSFLDFCKELGKLTRLSQRRKNRIWGKAVTADHVPQSEKKIRVSLRVV